QPLSPRSARLLLSHTTPTDIYTLSLHDALPISKIGTVRFTSYAMTFSAIAVIIHAYFYNGMAIWDFEREVYLLAIIMAVVATVRSEEHTSELQSRENLVCRLLLAKKKKSEELPR